MQEPDRKLFVDKRIKVTGRNSKLYRGRCVSFDENSLVIDDIILGPVVIMTSELMTVESWEGRA